MLSHLQDFTFQSFRLNIWFCWLGSAHLVLLVGFGSSGSTGLARLAWFCWLSSTCLVVLTGFGSSGSAGGGRLVWFCWLFPLLLGGFVCLTFTFVVPVVVGCSSAVQGTWTKSRTCKALMLYQTSTFNQTWNLDKVTSMPGMYLFFVITVDWVVGLFNFYFCCSRCCWAFTRCTGNVHAVTSRTYRVHILYQTSAFNQDWNVGKVTSMPGMSSFFLVIVDWFDFSVQLLLLLFTRHACSTKRVPSTRT